MLFSTNMAWCDKVFSVLWQFTWYCSFPHQLHWPPWYIPITYIVWWYNTLYQVESVVWTSITTSCDAVSSRNRYTVLYHHTMYVISLSNISIKTNFKQIARVELKCVQYSEGDYILCMTTRYFLRSCLIVLFVFVSVKWCPAFSPSICLRS